MLSISTFPITSPAASAAQDLHANALSHASMGQLFTGPSPSDTIRNAAVEMSSGTFVATPANVRMLGNALEAVSGESHFAISANNHLRVLASATDPVAKADALTFVSYFIREHAAHTSASAFLKAA